MTFLGLARPPPRTIYRQIQFSEGLEEAFPGLTKGFRLCASVAELVILATLALFALLDRFGISPIFPGLLSVSRSLTCRAGYYNGQPDLPHSGPTTDTHGY
jgi:hypothetical protein